MPEVFHQLFGKGKNDQQRLLLCIIGPIKKIDHKETALFVEEIMHLFHDNAPAIKLIKMMAKINELRFELFHLFKNRNSKVANKVLRSQLHQH